MVSTAKSYILFGISALAVTNEGSTEEEEDYSGYDMELTNDIMALLEARGYQVCDLILNFKEQQVFTNAVPPLSHQARKNEQDVMKRYLKNPSHSRLLN